MEELWAIILLIFFNTVVYGISFFYIYKSFHVQSVSLRSPILLILNNAGGFLMSTTYIFYELCQHIYPDVKTEKENGFKNYCKILPNNYLIPHFLMILSYILRYHRIIACCKIETNEDLSTNDFASIRHKYLETYYLKILAILMFIVSIVSFVLNYLVNNYYILPYYFDSCLVFVNNDTWQLDDLDYISYFWIVLNFMENVVLITYTYFVISSRNVTSKIKLELSLFTFIWIVFHNLLRVFDIFEVKISDFGVCLICLFFLWGCLFVNGFLPIIYKSSRSQKFKYTFNSDLANSCFLFLSQEDCVKLLLRHLQKKNDFRGLYYFRIYTDIMKMKMKANSCEPSEVIDFAKVIFNNYFNLSSSLYFDDEVLKKLKENSTELNSDEVNINIFDEGLVVAYDYLFKVYKDLKEEADYQALMRNLDLSAYIQCKLCNTGLINPIS